MRSFAALRARTFTRRLPVAPPARLRSSVPFTHHRRTATTALPDFARTLCTRTHTRYTFCHTIFVIVRLPGLLVCGLPHVRAVHRYTVAFCRAYVPCHVTLYGSAHALAHVAVCRAYRCSAPFAGLFCTTPVLRLRLYHTVPVTLLVCYHGSFLRLVTVRAVCAVPFPVAAHCVARGYARRAVACCRTTVRIHTRFADACHCTFTTAPRLFHIAPHYHCLHGSPAFTAFTRTLRLPFDAATHTPRVYTRGCRGYRCWLPQRTVYTLRFVIHGSVVHTALYLHGCRALVCALWLRRACGWFTLLLYAPLRFGYRCGSRLVGWFTAVCEHIRTRWFTAAVTCGYCLYAFWFIRSPHPRTTLRLLRLVTAFCYTHRFWFVLTRFRLFTTVRQFTHVTRYGLPVVRIYYAHVGLPVPRCITQFCPHRIATYRTLLVHTHIPHSPSCYRPVTATATAAWFTVATPTLPVRVTAVTATHTFACRFCGSPPTFTPSRVCAPRFYAVCLGYRTALPHTTLCTVRTLPCYALPRLVTPYRLPGCRYRSFADVPPFPHLCCRGSFTAHCTTRYVRFTAVTRLYALPGSRVDTRFPRMVTLRTDRLRTGYVAAVRGYGSDLRCYAFYAALRRGLVRLRGYHHLLYVYVTALPYAYRAHVRFLRLSVTCRYILRFCCTAPLHRPAQPLRTVAG